MFCLVKATLTFEYFIKGYQIICKYKWVFVPDLKFPRAVPEISASHEWGARPVGPKTTPPVTTSGAGALGVKIYIGRKEKKIKKSIVCTVWA